MMTRMMLDVADVLRYFLDCNNMRSSDVVLQEQNVVLRCFKWWMMCYDRDTMMMLDMLQEQDAFHDGSDAVRCFGSAKFVS